MTTLTNSSGPYVAAATFCERVMREADDVMSVLRIVDQINVSASGPEVADEMPPVPLNLTIVVILRRGSARGRHKFQIVPEDPSGVQRGVAAGGSLNLVGEPEAGSNIIADFSGFVVDQEGLWWFDFLFGDSETPIARIPLRVNYHPQRTPQ